MAKTPEQILRVAQMRDAEQALMDRGDSVDMLMQRAGRGAADYVWRMAGHRPITVLVGPGNNGGDGYVLAEAVRERGGRVVVAAAEPPRSEAAQRAAVLYQGPVLRADEAAAGAAAGTGDVLVDCLFGSGLTRKLGRQHLALLRRLTETHPVRIAIDLPSGVEGDSGALLNEGLPDYRLTLALGAWKPAHVLMPAVARMGELRLIDIGILPVPKAGRMLRRPHAVAAPAADAHKYTRGLLLVAAGAMAGAALLAARAAAGAGAGYVQVMQGRASGAGVGMVPADLVVTRDDALDDARVAAMLIGPGLGRDTFAKERLAKVLRSAWEYSRALVLDADALFLLRPKMLVGRAGMLPERLGPAIATPHEGELIRLESLFGLRTGGSRVDRAIALARMSGLVIVAKGPDTIIAAPDGHWLAAPHGSSWLSTAGSGDVLAGCIASRLACGQAAFAAAAQGVWLHHAAARLAGPAFTAAGLATHVPAALASCL